MENELLTIHQASELLGNSVQHVRLLARTGNLRAVKVGRDWLVNRDAVIELQTKRVTAPLIPLKRVGRSPMLVRDAGNGYSTEQVINPHGSQLSMGIGETNMTNNPTESITVVDRRNQLNELTATEWLPETVSVWVQKGLGANHPDAQIEHQHPAPFSFTDVARLIRFFTKRDAVVLDPFVGIGSTLKACALNGRYGIGIELNPKYVELTNERLGRELPPGISNNHTQKVIEGDAREILSQLTDDSVDFVVTSPPYSNILHKEDHKARQERIANGLDTKYSNDPRDLGNIHDYRQFLTEVTNILGRCGRVLKPKKYMAVIVSDYRQGSKYVMFHADLARSLEAFNFHLHGMTILYQKHKRVFPYGYPFSFVPNIHHQTILIMRNGK